MDDVRRPFLRSPDRQVAGVAAGLAGHLALSVTAVRLAFLALALYGGFGVVLYLAFWAVVPQSDEPPPPTRTSREGLWLLAAVVAGALGVGAATHVPAGLVWPSLLAAAGLVLIWRAADDVAGRDTRRAGWIVLGGGLAFLLVGLVTILSAQRPDVGGFIVTGVVLVLAATAGWPWWRGLAVELSRERRARIRSQERAEVAAHLHDSVLQTLTLIQRQVHSPAEVQRLARRQERELRDWISGAPGKAATLTGAVRALADEVEDDYGVLVDLVSVGDAPTDERVSALAQAAGEAMRNAARHSGATTLSVFVEVEAGRATVFVRDRGAGFDVDAVAAGRHGIEDSIIGRMQRSGGRATVRGVPGTGTEVELELPW
jgi:signal transduction histidine kinase/phage shock protein PspC (stress-responsive transcriptional regulator)